MSIFGGDKSPEPATRMSVRSVPVHIMNAMDIMAKRNERSLEGEIRHALRTWVQPVTHEAKKSIRIQEVSGRLNRLIEDCGLALKKTYSASQLALITKMEYAEPAEQWMLGEKEPSLNQLIAIAHHFNSNSDWLLHGEQNMFKAEHTRIPESPIEGLRFLIKDEGIHLIRERSRGAFAFVLENSSGQCSTYQTPYYISEQTGTGGEASLAWLMLTFELLYLYYTQPGCDNKMIIKSYLMDSDTYSSLVDGKTHPKNALRNASEASWWEDIWHKEQFNHVDYWDGWKPLCEKLAHRLETTPYSKERGSLTDQLHLYTISNPPR